MTGATISDPAIVRLLRLRSRQAGAAVEALLRWSYLLEMAALREQTGVAGDRRDPSANPALSLQQALKIDGNPVLALVAGEVLQQVDPAAVDRARLKANTVAARRTRSSLWEDLIAYGAEHGLHGPDGLQELLDGVVERVTEIRESREGSFAADRRRAAEAKPRAAATVANVVALFGAQEARS